METNNPITERPEIRREIIPVTQIPSCSMSEIHMADAESCDALYAILHDNLYDPYRRRNISVTRPESTLIRLDAWKFSHLNDLLYSHVEQKILDKIVYAGEVYRGYPLQYYLNMLSNRFDVEFARRKTDPAWLREHGLEGTKKWNQSFISDADGYHVVEAIMEGHSRIGALDHRARIFLPFEETELNRSAEAAPGYMQEIRRRLLSEGERVDSLGRISFAGKPVVEQGTGTVHRDLLVDGEAKAYLALRPDDDIYTLRIALELPVTREVVSSARMASRNLFFEDGFKWRASGVHELLEAKDRYYPPRVLADKVNLPLDECLALGKTLPAGASLMEAAQKASRLSAVRIERRGAGGGCWIAGRVDGEPVLSEKLSDGDVAAFRQGQTSALVLGMKYFSASLAYDREEEIRRGVRM